MSTLSSQYVSCPCAACQALTLTHIPNLGLMGPSPQTNEFTVKLTHTHF